MPEDDFADRAIVIGIDQYDQGPDWEGRFQPLTGARNDARHMHRWLTDPNGGGVEDEHCALHLHTAPGGTATHLRSVVENALGRWVHLRKTRGGHIGRRGWFYFSGHGLAVQGLVDEVACLMSDATREQTQRHVPVLVIEQMLKSWKVFEEVVVIADCCRERDARSAPSPNNNSMPPLGTVPGGETQWVRMLATRWGRLAKEQDLPDPFDPQGATVRQGRFTHALLRALTQATPSGTLDVATLRGWATEHVRRLAPAFEFTPPEIASSAALTFRTGKVKGVPLQVAAPNQTTTIRVSQPPDPTTHDHPAAGGSTTLHLLPGLYKLAFMDAAGSQLGTTLQEVT